MYVTSNRFPNISADFLEKFEIDFIYSKNEIDFLEKYVDWLDFAAFVETNYLWQRTFAVIPFVYDWKHAIGKCLLDLILYRCGWIFTFGENYHASHLEKDGEPNVAGGP